ncbi:MAG TPA: hypothetical protein VH877_34260 [Polyangia bacterium]|nr:hypothetical protein [Polyangia bacterium]
MSWLSADAWLAACGAAAHGLYALYEPQGNEDGLAAVLAADPRRLLVLVGAPGAGTSRLALELARQGGTLAFYPDPAAPPDPLAVAALAEALRAVPETARPIVVLDGPLWEEALAWAAPLVHEPLHPRLLVIVPCTIERAPEVPRRAGRYAPHNIIVAQVAGQGAPPVVPGVPLSDDLLGLALAGRRPTCTIGGLEALHAERLAASHAPSGTTVCLLGERQRRALADAAGPARIAGLLHADPTIAPGAFVSLMRWTRGALPAEVLAAVLTAPAGELAALLERARQEGVLEPEAAVTRRLRDATQAALAGDLEEDTALALMEQAALFAAAAADVEGALAHLRAVIARAPEGERRRRLLGLAATLGDDLGLYAATAATLRQAGDAEGEARVLAAWATALFRMERWDEAAERAAAWLNAEEARGFFSGRLAARQFSFEIAIARHRYDEALTIAASMLPELRARADVRGQVLALRRVAWLHMEAGDDPAAEGALGEALGLELAIGDELGAATCRWSLGDLAMRRGDALAAVERYGAALAIHEAHDLPTVPRLRAALAAARIAASAPAGTGAISAPTADPLVSAPPLVELRATRPKPRSR